ncbi:hypothetical protein C3L33_03603, partial [Rhododendron williamsianum]
MGSEGKNGDTVGGNKEKKKSIAMIFGCADFVDILLMLLGTLGAIGDGMSTNCLLLYASRLFNSLGYGNTPENHGNFMVEVDKCSLFFVYLGLAVMVVAFMDEERQVLKIRYKYLEAVLRQEVGYFESKRQRLRKLSTAYRNILLSYKKFLARSTPNHPPFSDSWHIYGKYLLYLSNESFKEYGKANAIVEQALSSIKTVYSSTAEANIIERYSRILDQTTRIGLKKGAELGHRRRNGISWPDKGESATRQRDDGNEREWRQRRVEAAICVMRCRDGDRSVAIVWPEEEHATSTQSRYVRDCSSDQDVVAKDLSQFGVVSSSCLIILLIICQNFFQINQIQLTIMQIPWSGSPRSKYFTEASVAATQIFDRINRIPQIDGGDKKGIVLENMRGEVEFDHVRFTYPSRPDSIVLKDFNLKIEAGKTVALVGASGSGKSTTVALLQRFYDADGGVVRIDGVGIQRLQLKWLRGQMGLVSQEHALFGTSIKENIMFGKLDASMDEVVAAAMAANAHCFIRELPEGYETKVGDVGYNKPLHSLNYSTLRGQLSRMHSSHPWLNCKKAISLVSLWKLPIRYRFGDLLHSLTTGGLDQVVAHKLSTVRNADAIAVVSGGCIIEIGSHNDLINRKNGHYAKLEKLQGQFSSDDQDQHYIESRVSSVARSSAGRLSTGRSSPAVFAAPLPSGLIGSLSAIAFGAIQPVYALTIGGMISAFFLPSHEEMRARIRTYALIFSTLSIISIVVNLLQHYNFSYMGEQLTKRIRLKMLEKVLTFEAAWFDEEKNSSGALCAGLSNEASLVKSLVADRVSLLIQTISAVMVAMILGLVVAWKLALVMIAVQPLTILFYNHRIVTSFGSIKKVLGLFEEAQNEPRREGRKKSWLAGIGMGSAQCLTFMSWALDFWYGGRLVRTGEISAGDVFKTFFILVSTGKVIAEAGSMTSDLAKGSIAVASCVTVIDIDFYVTISVAQFSLEMKPGSSIGLVGKSGCGKSTVIALIQRFYDIEKGAVKIDGVDISIRDNIMFGKLDASENDVVEAARAANAHQFISSLQDGYETECGERGVQLSGGQKQRIAIARAIIRKPTILLLDEATSALDVQSEQVVQEALDRIMVGRTTVVVAHRLNTIKNLDSIAFVANGKVLERGTFAQLKNRRGAFFNLCSLQNT